MATAGAEHAVVQIVDAQDGVPGRNRKRRHHILRDSPHRGDIAQAGHGRFVADILHARRLSIEMDTFSHEISRDETELPGSRPQDGRVVADPSDDGATEAPDAPPDPLDQPELTELPKGGAGSRGWHSSLVASGLGRHGDRRGDRSGAARPGQFPLRLLLWHVASFRILRPTAWLGLGVPSFHGVA